MANEAKITAVITAKDQASGVIKGFSKNTDKAARESAEDFKKIGVAITALGVGLTVIAKKATDFTVDYVKGAKALARETGTTTVQASRLLAVTAKLGIDAEKAGQVFGLFSKKIVETAQSSDAATTSLGKLGVSAKDADGSVRDFNAVLLDTADKFKAMPDGAAKTALALELFGRSGKDMIKVLNLGSKGIQDLENEADKLGLTLNLKTISAVNDYIKSSKRLKQTNDALKIQIGTLTAPVLTGFNDKLNQVITSLAKTNGPLKNATANVAAFGGPVLSAAGGALTFAANWKTAGLSLARLGPTALVVGATIGVLVAGFTIFRKKLDEVRGVVHRQDLEEENLNATLREQVTTLEDVKNATRDLSDARMDVTGSSLDLERSQRSYNEAVKEYGPNSLEAREAAFNLEQAKLRLADAQQKVIDTQVIEAQKQAEMAAQAPSAAAAVKLIVDKYSQLAGSIGQTIKNTGTLQDMMGLIQGPLSNFKGELKAVDAVASRVSGVSVVKTGNVTSVVSPYGGSISGVGVARRGSVSVGNNAEGTDFWRGGPTWVGEKGPEIINAPRGSSITPNDKATGNVSINVNVGMYAGTEIEKRKMAQALLDAMRDLAGSNNMSVGQLLG